jgi:hypothetical protein
MQPDNRRLEEAAEWLRFVTEDLRLADIVLPHLDLSAFATLYRYPGEPVLPTVAQARPWVEAARGIYAAVEERVKAPTSEPPRETEEGTRKEEP